MGGVTWDSLEEWVDILGQAEEWDLLLLQETFRNVEARHFRVPQGWDIVHTAGRGRSAPAIAINQRMAGTMQECFYGETFVAAVFRMQPVLIAISWHAPNAGQGSEEEELFQNSLGELEGVLARWETLYLGAKQFVGLMQTVS